MKVAITRHAQVNPQDLLAHPDNFRVHLLDQQVFMKAVLDEVGWVGEVIVNERSGRIIDGHLRVTLALQQGEATVPVSYCDLDEEQEALALLFFDYAGSLADIESEPLAELLDSLPDSSEPLAASLKRFAVEAGIPEGLEANDPAPVAIAEAPLAAPVLEAAEEPDETDNEGALVVCSVGDIAFVVEKPDFVAWVSRLRAIVGRGRDKAMQEILKRLDLRVAE